MKKIIILSLLIFLLVWCEKQSDKNIDNWNKNIETWSQLQTWKEYQHLDENNSIEIKPNFDESNLKKK